ncbi:MAG TPA: selenocysteine-specific translation elongation factor [Candidatus Limnocylindrales bacterium]|nr:selenocysteine-specific translation elongation factor [Candidatus Limnocylindrales bacterium]
MPTVVIGTAGHIDHGKTTLLRALTGIDADRLPEERRRGMTIDVGYAHLALDDGLVLDFVDVPGHERLVGNMLVGAGEVDAVLLVVAADDGPRPQTHEHLALVDALGLGDGVVAVTKADLVDPARASAVTAGIEATLSPTRLAGSPIVLVSSTTGAGLDELRDRLRLLARRVEERHAAAVPAAARIAIDRMFHVRGRGTVVTGTLRGGSVRAGAQLRLVPGEGTVRVREVQVHGATVETAGHGRTALLVAGVEPDRLARGMELTADDAVEPSSRLLVALRPALGTRLPDDRTRGRLHIGTEAVDALVIRPPRESAALDAGITAVLRLERPVAAAPGDTFVLRGPEAGAVLAGGLVLDVRPPRGISRRRTTPERLEALATAAARWGADRSSHAAARLALHGAVGEGPAVRLAPDAEEELDRDVRRAVAGHHARDPDSTGLAVTELRAALSAGLRRRVTLSRAAASAAADAAIARAVRAGAIARDGDRLREPGREALAPAVRAAMDRLEAALATPTPPALSAAARAAGCPPDGVRALEAERRIVRLEDDLAWAASTYRELARLALGMAARGPLTPAAFRDATGSSRRFALAILEDLDRRELLARTPDGHRLGPRAVAKAANP